MICARPSSVHVKSKTLTNVNPRDRDINFVIMDYLINEGYPAAAKKFASEANIQLPSGGSEYIQERLEIRNAILAGDIQTAIEKINDLNPDVSAPYSYKKHPFARFSTHTPSQ